jgi:branched-chain amino acid transport system permease protein
MLLVAGAVAGIIAIPFGWIALRARRHTFVVITIAYLFIFQLLAYNLTSLTNGSAGIGAPIPPWMGSAFNIPFFYVALALAVAVIVVSTMIRRSRFGLSLLAIRDDEDRALGLGIPTGRLKLIAFVIAATFIAMAGALYAYYVTFIYPQYAMNPLDDLSMALMAFLGGVGTIAGPVIGALIVEPSQQYFTIAFQSGLNLITYGGLFLVVILFIPRGLWPTLRDALSARAERLATQSPVEPPPKPKMLSAKGGPS